MKYLHLGMEDGLPSQMIYRIYKDHHGYLWFATDNGIAKYNGTRFIQYNTLSGLPDNVIFFMMEDHEDRMWFGTFNGALCYLKNDTFFTSGLIPELKLDFKSTIRGLNIFQDSSVCIFFDNQRFVTVKGDKLKVYNSTMKFDLIFKNAPNEFKLLLKGDEILIDTLGNKTDGHKDVNKGLTIAYDRAHGGKYYFLSDSSVMDMNHRLIFQSKEKIINHYYMPDIFVSDSNFYLSTKYGIATKSGEVLLKNIPISSIITDIDGDYWVSTLGYGVFVIKKSGKDFSQFDLKLYPGEKVLSAKNFSNRICFSTDRNCIYEFDKQSKNTILKSNAGVRNTKEIVVDDNGFIFKSLENEDAVVLHDGWKIRLNKGTGFKQIFQKEHSFYCVGYNNVSIYNKKTTISKESKVSVPDMDLSLGERIHFSAYNYKSNSLWCSTTNGLSEIFNGKIYKHRSFKGMVLRNFIFCGNQIVAIDDKGGVLLADAYRSIKPEIHRLRTADVLWRNLSLINDSTVLLNNDNSYSLLSFNIDRNKKLNYHFRILENPFLPKNPEALILDATHLYFLKQNKIIEMHKDVLFRQEESKLKIIITSIKTNTRNYLPGTPITIPYKEAQNTTIFFDVLSFQNKELDVYYSLSESKNNWQKITSREINLYALPYGDYKVRLLCCTRDKKFRAETSFMFSVATPFWATAWFFISCTVGGVIIFSLIVYIIIKRIKRKDAIRYHHLLTYQKLEFRSLNALMNPHFIFNCLNSIQGLINGNNKKEANKFLIIFSKIIRKNMHNISKDLISIWQELDLIEAYLQMEQMRFENTFNYEIKIEDGLNVELIQLPPLLVQPLVENAVKHGILPLKGQRGYIELIVSKQQEVIKIEVLDNGIGISNSIGSTDSYGLHNIRERIESYNYINSSKLYFGIENRMNQQGVCIGTKATITMEIHPLGK